MADEAGGYGGAFTRRLLREAGVGPRTPRVLDVGCGRGDVTLLVADLVGSGARVVGVDRDEGALAVARERAGGRDGITFVRADLATIGPEVGRFDAVVGRRVLLYQRDPVAVVQRLAALLPPGGLLAFHEHDRTLPPASLAAMPLHRLVLGWITLTIEREGADNGSGLRLRDVLHAAGLTVEAVLAEAAVQTPERGLPLAGIIAATWPRLVAKGVATEAEIDLPTLEERLAAERLGGGTLVAELFFGAVARVPG